MNLRIVREDESHWGAYSFAQIVHNHISQLHAETTPLMTGEIIAAPPDDTTMEKEQEQPDGGIAGG